MVKILRFILKSISVYCLVFFLSVMDLKGQSVYHHVANSNIYEFLDEMANDGLISLNSCVKPYTRIFIAQKLNELDSVKLNIRQKKELNFYLKDFGKELFENKTFSKRKDLFFYKDTFFTISVNPILGINYFKNKNGNSYHRWNGAEAFSYLGKHWGAYASLRDNHESQLLSSKNFLNQRTGAAYKIEKPNDGADYSEMRGGLTYSNNWATIGLIKDHFVWGNAYNGSNIFSGKTPSITHFKIEIKPVKWFDFNYITAWLVSGIIDSSRTYTSNGVIRENYRSKFLTANMFTFKLLKKLYVSGGNSVVYSSLQNPAYLIPVFFYKSLDHTLVSSNNGGTNAQMFIDVSSRNIKHAHVYATLYIDEISISRMFDKARHSNFIGSKIGLKLSNPGIKNLFLTTEFTRTNPITYKHFQPATTFESNGYNLGYYLRDNAQNTYISVVWKPIRRLQTKIAYSDSKAGPDYPDIRNPNLVWGLPFLSSIEWRNTSYCFSINYEIINDFLVWGQLEFGESSGNLSSVYNPELFRGNTSTINIGFNFGF